MKLRKLNFNFYLILITLNLNSEIWLVATIMDSIVLKGGQYLKGSILFPNDSWKIAPPSLQEFLGWSLPPSALECEWGQVGGPNTQSQPHSFLWTQPTLLVWQVSACPAHSLRPVLLKLPYVYKQETDVAKMQTLMNRFGMEPETAFSTSWQIRLMLLVVWGPYFEQYGFRTIALKCQLTLPPYLA